MDNALLEQIDAWHELDEHEKIVSELEKIPAGKRDYQTVCLLARAYNNLDDYDRAAQCLLSVQEEGEDDPLWHYRLGYSYYYLDRDGEAQNEFERAVALNPEDPDSWMFLALASRAVEDEDRFFEASNRLKALSPERWEETIGETNGGFSPELYEEEEIDALEEHIRRHFGEFESVFHELISPDIHVDIAVIPPTGERNFYTLVTMGMGAHRMAVPEELSDRQLDRAEMVVCLPPDWEIENSEEVCYWPLRWLKIMARLPGEQETWLGWGHPVPAGGPLAENTKLSCMLLVDPYTVDGEGLACEMPDGSLVRFYQLFPIYEDEMNFKIEHGASALLERFGRISPVVDVNRLNVCDFSSVKQFAKSPDEIEQLLDWDGPEGCIASDRILVDGERVGYCYREEPDEGVPDSGWRFLAGDESEEYLDDPRHSGVYALNTLCNYDPDILPLLEEPVGSAFARGRDGKFVPVS